MALSIASSLPHRVTRLLGAGGMGAVYEAWDDRLQRRVALKQLHAHLTALPANRDRLLREAQLAARVEHEGVVRVYGIHEYDGGLVLEMQYVDGTPLHRMLANRSLSPVQAADLLRQVLAALAACHGEGVIHSDLKPGNLLVKSDGKILLTDFGISRAFFAEDGVSALTSTLSGPLWGTPQYSPPEAWEGERPTPLWDLYALGVLVHEGLTQTLPFQAHTPAILMREKLEGPHASIAEKRPDVSPELAALIDALQATDPAQRPESAKEALRQLYFVPENRRDIAPTLPFCHDLSAIPEEPGPVALSRPLLAPGEGSPVGDGYPSRTRWWVHGAWAVVALSAIAVVSGIVYVSNPVQETAPAVAPAVGAVGEILEMNVLGDTALFSYDDGRRGRELWAALPSGAVEMVADINKGPGSSNPHGFMPRSGAGFLFAATTAENGEEPWYCSDGVARQTWMVRDIIGGPMSSEPLPVASWEQTFMFFATTLPNGREPWLTTTLDAQTGILKDLNSGAGSSVKKFSHVLADATGAYLIGLDGSVHEWRLFRFDYAEGTISSLVRASEFVGGMALLGDSPVFSMPDRETGFELWIYRPQTGAMELLADILPGTESSYPQEFYVWKDTLYFQAVTRENGKELWTSDGTVSGTKLFFDIEAGRDNGDPYGFVATDTALFFRASDRAHGQELWRTDGTVHGTRIACDVWPGTDSSKPYNIAPLGHFLFLTADDGVHGEELFALDLRDLDQAPRLIADIVPGEVGSEPHGFQSMGPSSGVFVYKKGEGEALMRLDIEDDEIRLAPYQDLPLVVR